MSLPILRASGITKWPRWIWFYCQDTATAIKILVTGSPALTAMCHGCTNRFVLHKWNKLVKAENCYRFYAWQGQMLFQSRSWLAEYDPYTASGTKEYGCQYHASFVNWYCGLLLRLYLCCLLQLDALRRCDFQLIESQCLLDKTVWSA